MSQIQHQVGYGIPALRTLNVLLTEEIESRILENSLLLMLIRCHPQIENIL